MDERTKTQYQASDESKDNAEVSAPPAAPAASSAPSKPSEQPSTDSGPHDYREIADGVEARQTTGAEREARNEMAAAADKLSAARGSN